MERRDAALSLVVVRVAVVAFAFCSETAPSTKTRETRPRSPSPDRSVVSRDTREVKVLSGYGPVSRDDSYRYSSFMTASMFHWKSEDTSNKRERPVRAESWSTDDRPHCTQRSERTATP